MSNDLVTAEQICDQLGICRASLNAWIRRGLLPPAVKRGLYGVPFYAPITKEQAIAARRANEANALEGMRLGGKKRQRFGAPAENMLTIPEAATAMGITAYTFRRRVDQGFFEAIEGRWIDPTKLQHYKEINDQYLEEQKLSRGKFLANARADAKRARQLERPQKPSRKTFIQPQITQANSGSYDEIVAEAKKKPEFQTALGFNLLAHRVLGFRAVGVAEEPGEGWRYYERHHRNGMGQWCIKYQNPNTGHLLA